MTERDSIERRMRPWPRVTHAGFGLFVLGLAAAAALGAPAEPLPVVPWRPVAPGLGARLLAGPAAALLPVLRALDDELPAGG
jgi:hypothetical protein